MRISLFVTLALIVGCGSGPASVPSNMNIPVPPGPPLPEHTAEAPAAPGASSGASAPQPDAADTVPHAAVKVSPEIQAIVDAKDRSDADKKLDEGRHAAELLAFLDLKPGMRVAELAVTGGYTTELLARAVGPKGKVFGENNKLINEKFAEKPWSERLKKPVMKNVVRVDREFDDPLPPDAKDLDAVVINLFYHDTVWMKADRDKMNAAIFKALKPGGQLVVVDHSGKSGTGTTEVQTIHRIEEKVVRDEVVKAGFKLAAQADFYRNPSDSRDWNTAPSAAKEKRGTSDRFVLRFLKP